GQKSVPVHIFPFTMNDENMRQAQAWPEYNFWRMLKPGYDYFEKNHRLPTITVENRRYKISPTIPASHPSPNQTNAAAPDDRKSARLP
ncbi:hypothetical protein C4652_04825, partial [Salmonella enterica subsp. enterica serovar Weslaco]